MHSGASKHRGVEFRCRCAVSGLMFYSVKFTSHESHISLASSASVLQKVKRETCYHSQWAERGGTTCLLGDPVLTSTVSFLLSKKEWWLNDRPSAPHTS
ncbi:hypothetical protein Pmani_012177 [Petrolisthes manimaculis]|uniref:Uncharacterized protein n=1 Tax=Petrolisthes manimaculis TaxID=1843537 RepID=A0AAE1UAI1_9EUCA|nr:hypothetical protein Pmani_012177 [Petrolisthes manimaculis]